MMLNCGKTKGLCVCFARRPPEVRPIVIDSRKIEMVSSATRLGVVFSNNLKWQVHVDHITSKGAQRLYSLNLLKRAAVDPKSLVLVYVALVRPVVEYACQVWHAGLTKDQSKQLESIQRRALDIVSGHHLQASMWSGGASNSRRTQRECPQKFFQAMQRANHRLHHLLPAVREKVHDTRPGRTCSMRCNMSRFGKSLIPYAIKNWD